MSMIRLTNSLVCGEERTQMRLNGGKVFAVIDRVEDYEKESMLHVINLAFIEGEKEMLRKVKQELADLMVK